MEVSVRPDEPAVQTKFPIWHGKRKMRQQNVHRWLRTLTDGWGVSGKALTKTLTAPWTEWKEELS